MSWYRKGQSGAAILIGLIAVMIVLYVLFLPPQDRAQLLGESQSGGPGQSTTGPLFTATVGTVYLASTPAQTHNINSVTVQALQQGSVLISRDTMTVKNNVFEKAPGIITFTVDPALTANALLSMNVRSKSGGNLIVKLNGNEVFNQDVASRTVPPIALVNLQANNNLTIETSSVGFAFWRSNVYTLSNVQVTADVTDLSGATGTQHFTITQPEYSSLQTAILSFVPICHTEGRISISLNSVEIFSGVPDCGTINTLELAPGRLVQGDNELRVSTQDADIILDRVTVKTVGQEQQNRVFSFTLDPTQVQGKQVSMVVRFSDANTHTGMITVNGNTIPLQASDTTTIPITSYVRPGANTIAFAAQDKEFEVVSFDVLAS